MGARLGLPFFRLGEGPQLVVEDRVADEVSLMERDLRQVDRGVDGIIELPVGADPGAHQPARIEQGSSAAGPAPSRNGA